MDKITKYDNESNMIYNYRVKFIENYESSKDAIKYSKILANIKFRGCKYDETIYNKLKEYL